MIIGSIFHYFFGFNTLEFLIIVLCSFAVDFDILFVNFSEENNHRMFISHSVIPSIILLIIGLILNWNFLIICGLAYLSHIFIDTLDWGTNIFYFQKKIIGFKFLISKEEFENLDKYLVKYKVPRSFFDFKYYRSKLFLTLEAIFFLLMMFCIIYLAFEFIFTIILYFIGLVFHTYTHFRLKSIETH